MHSEKGEGHWPPLPLPLRELSMLHEDFDTDEQCKRWKCLYWLAYNCSFQAFCYLLYYKSIKNAVICQVLFLKNMYHLLRVQLPFRVCLFRTYPDLDNQTVHTVQTVYWSESCICWFLRSGYVRSKMAQTKITRRKPSWIILKTFWNNLFEGQNKLPLLTNDI